MKPYAPILQLSLVIVIVNLGLPLDYRLITGAGVFTAVYILSRAVGKVGSAYLGGKITKADPRVTKWLGFTLLPHSGVSLGVYGDRRKHFYRDRRFSCRRNFGNHCRGGDHQRNNSQ